MKLDETPNKKFWQRLDKLDIAFNTIAGIIIFLAVLAWAALLFLQMF